MNYSFNEMLRKQLYALQNRLALSDFEFEVDSEQAFLKKKDLKPNTIYVLTRELQNERSIGVDTQPIQILILSEQNSLDVARAFFSEFAKDYNFAVDRSYTDADGVSLWVKQQYSDPVVLSNFNTVAYGYRSVLYISSTMYIMRDVADMKDLTIDGKTVEALTFDISYNMSPNTQQKTGAGEYISKSMKSVSTLAITITVPATNSDLLSKVFGIMDEHDDNTTDPNDATSYGGNENFYISFSLGSQQFSNKRFKLTAVDYGAAINNVPAIRLGFML